MAKGAYIGVGGVAKKVKKMYIGVGGVAKKVKKVYIGVGGKARLCWSGASDPRTIVQTTSACYESKTNPPSTFSSIANPVSSACWILHDDVHKRFYAIRKGYGTIWAMPDDATTWTSLGTLPVLASVETFSNTYIQNGSPSIDPDDGGIFYWSNWSGYGINLNKVVYDNSYTKTSTLRIYNLPDYIHATPSTILHTNGYYVFGVEGGYGTSVPLYYFTTVAQSTTVTQVGIAFPNVSSSSTQAGSSTRGYKHCVAYSNSNWYVGAWKYLPDSTGSPDITVLYKGSTLGNLTQQAYYICIGMPADMSYGKLIINATGESTSSPYVKYYKGIYYWNLSSISSSPTKYSSTPLENMNPAYGYAVDGNYTYISGIANVSKMYYTTTGLAYTAISLSGAPVGMAKNKTA